MCDKNVPAKTLATQRVSICTRKMTYSQMPHCRISEDLERISNWANQWDTTFNASKSMHMFFNLRQPKTGTSPILTLGAVEIPFTERTRHLGVVLTSSLKWTDHVQSLIRKQSFHVFVLKRLAQRRNSAAIVKRLFVGLVRPALEYASPVWDGCPKRDCVALERIQLAVARAVLRCSRRDVSNTETLRRIGWPTLAWRRWRQKLSVLWDLLQQRGPPKLCDKVPRTAAQRCDYSLRNSSSPAIPLCRTFHRQNSFLPASLALFNSLPASVTSCSSKPAFLSALDKYFLPDKFNFGLS